jgi:hypothetical protein
MPLAPRCVNSIAVAPFSSGITSPSHIGHDLPHPAPLPVARTRAPSKITRTLKPRTNQAYLTIGLTGERLGVGSIRRICHHLGVSPAPILAQQGEYWLAGILTVVAAAIVTVVVLLSSRSTDRS